MIRLHYVTTDEMPSAVADGLSQLAYMREAADYAPSHPASAEEAQQALSLAREFRRAAKVKTGA